MWLKLDPAAADVGSCFALWQEFGWDEPGVSKS
jgi:hypothetical protein